MATTLSLHPLYANTGVTTRVSVGVGGTQGVNLSIMPTISADGRFVAFSSFASNLVPGDTNGQFDVFVHDRATGLTTRVSVDSAGTEADGSSFRPAISANGRFVAFDSIASNLVPGDTNGQFDIFVHDRLTRQTTRVSLDSAGTKGNGSSLEPAINADGRFVAFQSGGTNLVLGDTNQVDDIFYHDRVTGATTRVSVDSLGNQALFNPSISAAISWDGRFVAFQSHAENLVADDTNRFPDVFVRDVQAGVTTRVSVDSTGNQGNSFGLDPSISGDGRFVAFTSCADNLVPGDTNFFCDVFVHDRHLRKTSRVSVSSTGAEATSGAFSPAISGKGQFVAFLSQSSNLVSGDTNGAMDVFVHDRQTRSTRRVSVRSDGGQANGDSGDFAHSSIAISAGSIVAFESNATNLVMGDTNSVTDVFIRR